MKHLNLLSITAIVLMSAAGPGCSPASLFGNSQDPEIQKIPSYRRVNPRCAGLDVSQSKLSTEGARHLTDCLNAQGALGDFGKLVHRMDANDLAPFVRGLNETVLNSPRRLAELERTFHDLEERKLLDPAFAGLGELLQNDELIVRTLGLLKTAYAPQGPVEPLLRQAAVKLSTRIRAASVSELLDLAWIAADSPAFAQLWKVLVTDSSRVIGPEAAQGLLDYVRSDAQVVRQGVDYAIGGSLFAAMDGLVPADAAGIARATPGWASLMDATQRDDARIARGLGSMMGSLLQPIPCMQGTRAMDHLAQDFMAEIAGARPADLSATLQRSKLLQIWLSAPICELPRELTANYPALLDLATSPGVGALGEVIRAFHAAGLSDFVIRSVANPHFTRLYPLLSELGARGGWTDALLLASVADFSGADRRASVQETLKFVTEKIPGTDRSLYDVAVQGAARSDVGELTEWLRALGRAKLDPAAIARALGALREGYAVNDAHPLISLIQQSLHDAGDDAATLESLLRLTARPDFRPAVAELAAMAKDGRLKDLIRTTLDLFHGYAQRGALPIATIPPGQRAPDPFYPVRHRLDSTKLLEFRPAPPRELAACRDIDLSRPWNDAGAPGFETQWQTVAACANGDGAYPDLAASLQLLGTERTEKGATYHALLIRAYQAIQLRAADVSRLADWGLAALGDGRADRLLRGFSYGVQHALVEPLVALAAPVARDLEARAALRRLGAFGAQILRRADFQPALRLADDLIQNEPKPAAPARPTYDHARLARWVTNKECTLLPPAGPAREARIAERVREIEDEYENAAVNHGRLVDGKLRRSWSFADAKAELAPVFDKFARPAEEGPALEALLRFTARFADPAQYPAGYLEKWLRERAAKRSVINYMYVGETLPRVRYVNELDVLSLMLANADIFAPDPINMNFGMEFLTNIAHSWGDVPFEKRPPEIQAKYPPGKKCPTIAETVTDILETTDGFFEVSGYPALPKCAQVADPNDPDEMPDPVAGPDAPPPAEPGTDLAMVQSSLYNVKQTLRALRANADNGGLRVMRDLFFDLYYSTPPEFRDSGAGMRNNLSLATKLVNLGILRQAGRQLEGAPERDAVISAFFRTLVAGAAAPGMKEVTRALFEVEPQGGSPLRLVRRDQTLVWKTLEQIFALEKAPDIAAAKRLGLHALAAIDGLERRAPVLDASLRTLAQMLDRHRAYLVTRASAVQDFIKSKDVSDFFVSLAIELAAKPTPAQASLAQIAQAAVADPQRGVDLLRLVSAADGNEAGHRAWRQFADRWEMLDTDEAFQALRLREIGRQMLDTLEARRPERPEDVATARRLLDQLAAQIELGDMEVADQLVRLAGLKPEETNRLVASLANLVDGGDAHAFLEVIRRNLGNR